MVFVICAVTWLAAYLVGAVPFGYLIARWRGVDIFEAGSGNVGATNIGRVLGKRHGILVFLLDFGKGAVPVGLALAIRPWVELPASALEVGAGLSAFLGHLFPVYLRFRGGKGVATGAGVVAVLLPGPMLGALIVWIVVVAASRYVSLASLAAALVLCALRLVMTPAPFARENLILTLFCFLAVGLVFVRHHANIRRLLTAEENRLQDTPAMQQLSKIVHLLALGLWFGMTVFFTFVVALGLFGAFETEAQKADDERPLWFPAPYAFKVEPAAREFNIEPLSRKDQGTRAAGLAVSRLFPTYYLLQGICGFLAIIPALAWSAARPRQGVHQMRTFLLMLALVTVLVAWPIEQRVSELRDVRTKAEDALRTKLVETTRSSTPQIKADVETLHTDAVAARADFGVWHTISLFLNFLTVLLVTAALALASRLPDHTISRPPPG
jgi:glycerol-3-phosphate acyltransferase PlsY